MAKTKGIMSFQGSIDGLTYYYLNGKPIVRKRGGGFSDNRIKTLDSMASVRNNGKEFGHCSKVNKAFRMALRPFYEGYIFPKLHGRMLGLFTKIKNLDTIHEHGKRTVAAGIATSSGQQLLSGFNFTPACSVFDPLPFNAEFNWGDQSLNLSNIRISALPFYSNSSHIAFRMGVLDFNFETLEYQLQLSAHHVLDEHFTSNTLSLYPETTTAIAHTGIAVLGVQYLCADGNGFYPLQGLAAVGFGVIAITQ